MNGRISHLQQTLPIQNGSPVENDTDEFYLNLRQITDKKMADFLTICERLESQGKTDEMWPDLQQLIMTTHQRNKRFKLSYNNVELKGSIKIHNHTLIIAIDLLKKPDCHTGSNAPGLERVLGNFMAALISSVHKRTKVDPQLLELKVKGNMVVNHSLERTLRKLGFSSHASLITKASYGLAGLAMASCIAYYHYPDWMEKIAAMK